MKKLLFHLMCLGLLGYAISMVSELSSIWRFALAIWVTLYSGIAIRHLHNWIFRASSRALKGAAVSKQATTSERSKMHGETLVSDVQVPSAGDGTSQVVQVVPAAGSGSELARAALGPGDSPHSAKAEAGLARDRDRHPAEAPVAAAGGVR